MPNLVEIPQDKSRLIEFILKAKDLYAVLYVTKSAETTEIVKQYKKLSVLVHPDKNEHPKASEAFKKLSGAKRILADETARRRYDMTGSTSERSETPMHGNGFYSPSAEDFFEAFYRATQSQQRRRPGGSNPFDPFGGGGFAFGGGGFGGGNEGPQYAPRAGRSRRQEGLGWFPLFFMFAVLMGVTYLVGRTPGQTLPEFSLWKTKYHTVPHFTVDGLKFWMEPGKFDSANLLSPHFMHNFEAQVLQSWTTFKRRECSHDLQHAGYTEGRRPQSCVDLDKMTRRA